MKFLVDQNLSPLVAAGLCEAGHDAVHTRDLGLQEASDTVVLARASHERRIVVSADTDFGTLLAASRADGPSVVLVRRPSERTRSWRSSWPTSTLRWMRSQKARLSFSTQSGFGCDACRSTESRPCAAEPWPGSSNDWLWA